MATKTKAKQLKLPSDVLGSVLFYVPQKDLVNIIKSGKRLPKLTLLHANLPLANEQVCSALLDEDFDILIKNTHIDRQDLFECVVDRGLVDKVKILLKDSNVNPSLSVNWAIGRASKNGHHLVVRELLKDPRVDPSSGSNLALVLASEQGHLEVVKELLKVGPSVPNRKRVDPSDRGNDAIIKASKNGHLEIVRELLKDSRVDPSDRDNSAILIASYNGHLEVVKELKKDSRVDPTDQGSSIRAASVNGHHLVVRELLKDPRVDPTDVYDASLSLASENGHHLVVRELLMNKRLLRNKRFYSNDILTDSIVSAYEKSYFKVVKELSRYPKIKYPKKPDLEILTMILKALAR